MSAPASPPPPPQGDSIARGTGWMMLLRFADRSIGLISTLILARVLTPADFGLVAMAMTVVALIELMGAFGFDTALIQRQNVNRSHYDTAWTFNVIFSCSAAILLLVLAYPSADFYREPRLAMVLPLLAISSLAHGFENIGTVAFRKELNFRREFRFVLSKKLAMFAVTVSLALVFRSFWALIAGIVTGKLFSVWISYRLHPYRPRFCLQARHDLFHFSKWLMFSNMVLFLQAKADNFILGRTVGSHGLGIYNIAAEIAVLPSTELVAPINRAAFPAYARVSSDLHAFRQKFRSVFGLIAIVGFPAAFGLASVAQSVVLVMLGSRWMEAVPLMQMFTISGLACAIQSNLVMVILALGKPKVNTILNALTVSVHLPLLIVASVRYGPMGAACVHVAVTTLSLIPMHAVFFKLTGVKLGEHMASLWRPILGSALMLVSIFSLRHYIFEPAGVLPIIDLLASIIVGAIIYFCTVLGLWRLAACPEQSAERDILNFATRTVIPRLLGLKQSFAKNNTP